MTRDERIEAAEEWRQVTGYPNYEVSSLGRIRSTRPGARECLAVFPDTKGYLQYAVWRNGRKTMKKIHRLVALEFLGAAPDEMQVGHRDGIKENNAASNLKWCTAKENSADRIQHGTQVNGGQVKQGRLTEGEVTAIFHAEGPQVEIARRYGVVESVVSTIKRGLAWKHITVPMIQQAIKEME